MLDPWTVLPQSPARHQAVALASPRAREEIERLLPLLNLDVIFVGRVDLLSARVETACPEIIIIDTEVLALPGDLCHMARSMRHDVVIIALVSHWSEREERLKAVVDATLHRPPRRDEWERLFG